MKKLILSLSIIAIGVMTTKAQVSFGFQVGTNLASAKSVFKATGFPDETVKFKAKAGLLFGVVGEIPISGSVLFRPELNFIQKGGTFSETANDYGQKVTLNYVELPLNVVYNTSAGTGNVFFGAGPSFAFGISGKDKVTSNGQSLNVDVKFDGTKNATDNNFHLKSLDMGLGIIAGYKFASGPFFSLGYNFGLSNISPEDGETTKNSGFAVKFGYMLGGKKGK